MEILRSPVFWLLLVLALVCLGCKESRRSGGFKDIVKNPRILDEIDETRQEVDAEVEQAKKWSPDQIDRALRFFVFEVKSSRDAWAEERVLESLGVRLHPAIVAILQDQSRKSQLTVPTGKNLLPEAPINRLCQLMREESPAEAVGLLAPFLDDPSAQVRKDVAMAIGSSGTPAIVPLIRKACADPDEYVRSSALTGLEWAKQGGHLHPDCRRELFGDVQKLIAEGKNADQAKLLMEFDADRATEFFLSPAVFNPESRALYDVLRVLVDRRILVARGRLLALVAELDKTELQYPRQYNLAETLVQVGMHRQADDEALLTARMNHPEKVVAEGAATGLLAFHGLEEFKKALSEKEAKQGHSSLSPQQRYYSAVLELDGEVNNGGLSQYFFNSSGDQWREARDGLAAMGFQERAEIFREVLAQFANTSPSEDRETRQEQLAKLVRRDTTLFENLDSRYYKSNEVVDVFATRYVIKNANAFR